MEGDTFWCSRRWDVISLSDASPTLPEASESRGPDRSSPRLWSGPARAATRARASHPSHLVPVGPAPAPGRGRHGQVHPSRKTLWGLWRWGATRRCARCTHCIPTPRLSCPGEPGWPAEPGWAAEASTRAAGRRKIESTATTCGVRCTSSFVQIGPDCALNSVTPRAWLQGLIGVKPVPLLPLPLFSCRVPLHRPEPDLSLSISVSPASSPACPAEIPAHVNVP